ncbi:hypothetical protein [Methanosphaera sp. WGK6]|uniref:hypothetical protein n=1 Tax=Methanosphaera sp. WGK6 TaxID=1561964 RepID=UPI00084C1441|nr:hypothetical protein [Methanosphaera sp. WGK6]OED29530.1 hypothetical protein NL43_07710 [Methanosphaera sp. WGK6]
MAYTLIMEKDFEQKINELERLNIKEHTQLTKKIEEIQTHAEIRLNHKTKFNTFDKPLQKYKWIEINKKILVFTLDSMKKELHLYEYLPQNEVFC